MPLIQLGCAGGLQFDIIVNILGVPEPHELLAVTKISPPLAPAVTVIEEVEEVPLQPDGIVQVYDVAPETEAILYVYEAPWVTET